MNDEQKPRVYTVTIDAESAGQRVDNYLMRELKGVPRTRVYRLLRRGEVRINGSRVKASARLAVGDLLRIPPVRVAERQPMGGSPDVGKHILFEDDVAIVVNKPAGLAVHGGGGISAGVIEGLRIERPDAPYLELVHRLDKDTSGCLLIAKKRSFLRRVHELLRTKEGIAKTYSALVAGQWPGFTQINDPLHTWVRSGGERMTRVAPDGKPSLTRFRLERQGSLMALLSAMPVTGRTHQIRVHAAGAGCPVAGDDKYGNPETNRELRKSGINRMMLHASRLELNLPEVGYNLDVQAPPEARMQRALDRLA